jgi:putative FmdB family regulatory protein
MPIYDYVCSQCGHRVEVIHGINAEGPVTCEVCGGSLKKALSAPAIVFRGTGWAKKERHSSSGKASSNSGSSSATKEGDSGTPAAGEGSAKSETSGGEGATDAHADKAPASTASRSSEPSVPSGT